MLAYPMVDVQDPWYTVASEGKNPFGVPLLPRETVDGAIEAAKSEKVISEAFPPERLMLATAAVQWGRMGEMMGGELEEEGLVPLKVLETVPSVPYMFVLHSEQDSAVPVEGSRRFVEKVGERFGVEMVRLYTGPGEHGFDTESRLEEEWLKEGLVKVTDVWLK